MSDATPVVAMIVMLLLAAFIGLIVGHGSGRDAAREKFLTLCTSQNIPYAKCKEEWEKP